MPYGLRHAATLLLTNRIRSIPVDGPSDAIADALRRLAEEMVALARDMHAHPDEAAWLTEAFNNAIDRIPLRFDVESVRAHGRMSIAQLRRPEPPIERRDLFLVYVPADRLPIAAPLAIELTKRRVSVAFSEYEVASADELAQALERGLRQHRGGVFLQTPAFTRAGLDSPEESPRLKAARDAAEPTFLALVDWARNLRA